MEDFEQSDMPILFGPRDRKSLLRLYPEIAQNPKLKILASDDLLFAWYMGIPFSPCDHRWEKNLRVNYAANKCYGDRANFEKRDEVLNGNIADEVVIAIDEFSRFSPEARLKAKLIIQTTYNNYEKLVDVDVDKAFLVTKEVGQGKDKEVITEINWTAKNQYVSMTDKISDALPRLLKQLEEGFGITEKKGDGPVKKSIDKFHENKKGKSS